MRVRKWTLEGQRKECVEDAGQKMDSRRSKRRMRLENGLLVRTLRQECIENVGQKIDSRGLKKRMR